MANLLVIRRLMPESVIAPRAVGRVQNLWRPLRELSKLDKVLF